MQFTGDTQLTFTVDASTFEHSQLTTTSAAPSVSTPQPTQPQYRYVRFAARDKPPNASLQPESNTPLDTRSGGSGGSGDEMRVVFDGGDPVETDVRYVAGE